MNSKSQEIFNHLMERYIEEYYPDGVPADKADVELGREGLQWITENKITDPECEAFFQACAEERFEEELAKDPDVRSCLVAGPQGKLERRYWRVPRGEPKGPGKNKQHRPEHN